MKQRNSFLIALGVLLSTGMVQAQEQRNDSVVNRIIVIENEYTPEIMDASKINTLPAAPAPAVQQQAAEYAITTTSILEYPVFIGEYIYVPVSPEKTAPGLVRLGYGNYNNLDALANYRFRLSERDRLDAFFSMNGMKGKLDNLYEPGEKWKAHYYRTRASLDYRHQFNNVEFQTAGQFGLSNFNTLPMPPYSDLSDNQKFTSGSVKIGAQSTTNQLPMNFITSGEVLIFKRKHEFMSGESREGIFRLKGDLFAPIDANGQLRNQVIGLQVEMNNTFNHSDYVDLFQFDPNNTRVNVGNDNSTRIYLKNFTTVDLTPYYQMDNGTWKIRAGMHIDLAFNFGTKIRVSPDVMAQYTIAKNYLGYIKATGGRVLNDFYRLETVNPYAMMTEQPLNTYEQVNAAIGFKGSPVDGLWFHIAVGFQDLKDDLYTSMMTTEMNDKYYHYSKFENTNTQNTTVTGEASYSFLNVFKTGLGVTYYSWTADNDHALGYKPQLEVNWSLDVRPVEQLLIGAEFTHVKRCKPFEEVARVKAVNALGAKVSYNLFGGVSIYAQINNILSRKYEWYEGYAAERFNFLGGLSIKF